MKKRKAKRIKRVNEVNPDNTNEQMQISEFSDKEKAFLELIAQIIVRISIEESYKNSKEPNDEKE